MGRMIKISNWREGQRIIFRFVKLHQKKSSHWQIILLNQDRQWNKLTMWKMKMMSRLPTWSKKMRLNSNLKKKKKRNLKRRRRSQKPRIHLTRTSQMKNTTTPSTNMNSTNQWRTDSIPQLNIEPFCLQVPPSTIPNVMIRWLMKTSNTSMKLHRKKQTYVA